MTRKATVSPRVIDPNAVYTKGEVAELLDVHVRSVQRFEDLPWADLGEHTQRMLGSSLLHWLRSREPKAA